MATPATVETDLLQLATLNDSNHIRMAEEGLSTETVAQLRSLGLSFTEVAELVIPPRTLKHRIARAERLSTEETERLLRVVRIVAFVRSRAFGDHEKALGWLRDPLIHAGTTAAAWQCCVLKLADESLRTRFGRLMKGCFPSVLVAHQQPQHAEGFRRGVRKRSLAHGLPRQTDRLPRGTSGARSARIPLVNLRAKPVKAWHVPVDQSRSDPEESLRGELKPGKLFPLDWQSDLTISQRLGDVWLADAASSLLRVPSIPAPESWNYLLNPLHPDAQQIKIAWCRWIIYDNRLLGFREKS